MPELIKSIIDGLVSFTDQLTEGAIELLTSIVSAIPVIIDLLVEALPTIIETLIGGLAEAAPKLLDAGIRLLMSIVQAIPTIVSALVSGLPKIITTIVSTLISNLPLIIEASIKLLMGILKAIPQITIELTKQLPTIISSIVSGLVSGIPQIINAGKQLLNGLWQGLTSNLKSKISKVGNDIIKGFKDFFKIKSPSRKMAAAIGAPMADGLIVGFDKELKKNAYEMQDALNAAIPTATAAINATGNGTGTQGEGNRTTGGVVINQTNNYSQQHSRYEIYKSKQATAAAVRMALSEV